MTADSADSDVTGAPPLPRMKLHVHRPCRSAWLTVTGLTGHPERDRVLLRRLRSLQRRLGGNVDWLGIDLTGQCVTLEVAVLIRVQQRLCEAKGISLVAVLHDGRTETASATAIMQEFPLVVPQDAAHECLVLSARGARREEGDWTSLMETPARRSEDPDPRARAS